MMCNVITPQIQSDFRNLTLLVRILLSSNHWFLSKTCNCLTVILIHKFPQALRVKSSPTLKKSNTLFQYCKHSVYFSSNYLMILYTFIHFPSLLIFIFLATQILLSGHLKAFLLHNKTFSRYEAHNHFHCIFGLFHVFYNLNIF